MARFYAEIEGNRGRASRQGTEKSGMWAHIRGWDVGVSVDCRANDDGTDTIYVYETGGSNAGGRARLIAELTDRKENQGDNK